MAESRMKFDAYNFILDEVYQIPIGKILNNSIPVYVIFNYAS